MTRTRTMPSFILCALLFVVSVDAQQLDVRATIQAFPVRDTPYRLAFDGTNIWVTHHFFNGVTKLRASDGAVLGDFPTGGWSRGVVFDGGNIWATNYSTDDVAKLRA